MWHRINKITSTGAVERAAPLFVYGIKLRHSFQGFPVVEENLSGKLDTGSDITIIPISLAVKMRLPSAGFQEGVRSIDHDVVFPARYPKFRANIFLPGWGWKMLTVMACKRDSILLGRDICKEMLLIANWRCNGFGVKNAHLFHGRFKFIFSRLLMKKDTIFP